MSRSIDDLESTFAAKVRTLLDECGDRGLEMRPFSTLRSVWQQARFWRQSRTREEIERKIAYLKQMECEYLANVIDVVGPQYGQWATDAIPGESWHNHGLAVDCFLVGDDGRAIWDGNHIGYCIYAEVADDLGMVSRVFGGTKDIYHVQARRGSPNDHYPLRDISAMMQERFGETKG